MTFSYFYSLESYQNHQQAVLCAEDAVKNHGYSLLHYTQSSKPLSFEEINAIVLDSDVLIAEVSYPSTEVGIAVTKAIEVGRPVVLLYQPTLFKEKATLLPPEHQYVTMIPFTAVSIVKDKLHEFIKYAETQTKSRFNLALTRVHDHKVALTAYQEGTSKTKVIQDAIERKMHQDDQYRLFAELQKKITK